MRTKPAYGLFILGLSAQVFIASCKSLSSTSAPKHDFGAVSRVPLKLDCTAKSVYQHLAPLESYVTEMLRKIITANQAVLPADLSVDKLCLQMQDNFGGFAGADRSGAVTVGLNLLPHIDNDAQFAFVLSHELAHLLNAHGSVDAFPVKLAKDPSYQELMDAQRKIEEKYKKNVDPDDPLVQKFEGLPDILKGHLGFSAYYVNKLQEIERGKSLDTLVKVGIKRIEDLSNSYKDSDIEKLEREAKPKKDEGQDAKKEKDKEDEGKDLTEMSAAEILESAAKVKALVRYKHKSEYEKELKGAEKELVALMVKFLHYSRQIKDMRTSRIQYEQKHLGEAEGMNWSEQEADEVGLELYLRAGFAPDQASGFFRNLEKLVKAIEDDKKKEDENLKKNGKEQQAGIGQELSECSRGKESHPSRCWRIANFQREMEVHKEDYAKIISKDPIVTLFEGRLASLKKIKPLNEEEVQAPKEEK